MVANVCVSLTNPSQLSAIDPRCEFIEFRADLFCEGRTPGSWKQELASATHQLANHACANSQKTILTIRTTAEGGKFPDDLKRVELFKSLAPRFDFVDVEYSSKHRAALLANFAKEKKEVILSAHLTEPTIQPVRSPGFRNPKGLGSGVQSSVLQDSRPKTQNPKSEAILKAMHKAAPSAIKKIVFTATKQSDNNVPSKLLALAKKQNIRVICFCMGGKGIASRILAPIDGSYLTFGALDAKSATAPGQLVHSDLLDFYSELDFAAINPNTKFILVIGNPVYHSLSPKMQNFALRKMKLNIQYLKLRADHTQLGDILGMLRGGRFAGANVTVPYKEAVIPSLDSVDPEAKNIGAVNTIVNRKGKLMGYNTDGAIVPILGKTVKLKRARCILLGAGGASRAIVYGLKKAGADVTIINRTLDRAEALARAFGCKSAPLSLESMSRLAAATLFVNTTTIGMHGSPSGSDIPYLPRKFPKGLLVFDVVYTPIDTPLISKAVRECNCITGERMLIAQGVKALELFIGKKVPDEVAVGMHDVLLNYIQ